jgi:molybdopterin converting factor subunit 1
VTVQLLYFGMLKDFFEAERDLVELHEGATVGELVALLRDRAASDMAVWKSIAVAVNREYSGLERVLKDGDEVALLPPVSGGCGESKAARRNAGHLAGVPVQPTLASRRWGTGVAGGVR